MSHRLSLLINDQLVLEYDKHNRLPGHQRRFLDQMDADMDAGIRLGDAYIDHPDANQRRDYVAMTLIRATLDSNANLQLAACAYLAHRQPRLQMIKAWEQGEQIDMQLEYQQPED